MEKPTILDRLKRLFIRIENLPNWKPVTFLNLGPEQARYHEMGWTRKKSQYQAKSVYFDEVRSDHGIPFFKVPVEKCISANLFSYDSAKWHPYATPLRWYRSGRKEEAREMFFRFFKNFQPKTLGDFFFGIPEYPFNDFDPVIRESDKELIQVIPDFIQNDTFEDTAFPWSWRAFPTEVDIIGENTQPRIYFGPETENGIEAEWQRLTRLYNSLAKKNGNRTDFATPIDGYMICSYSDYRFIIRRGKHRVAVLSALGHSDIIATFTPGRPRSYDMKLIHSWPKVATGLWSGEAAEAVFRRCFICRHREIMDRLDSE